MKPSACKAMVEQVMSNVIPGLNCSGRPETIVRNHLIIKEKEIEVGVELVVSHGANVVQNTASPKHDRQVLELDLCPLLQARPPPFEPCKCVFSNALNLPNFFIEGVLGPC